MPLSNPVYNFGIQNITPYRREGGKRIPYGMLRVVAGGTLSLTSEQVDLFGGSSKYPFASEATTSESSFSCTVREFPSFLYELYLGAEVTETAPSSSGSLLQGLQNEEGTSVLNATTGLASVNLKSGSSGDLKAGDYLIVAASASTVDIYAYSEVSFVGGTNPAELVDDSLKLNATPIAVVSNTTIDVDYLGIQLEAGTGTVAFTMGDTARFKIAGPHGGVDEMLIGGPNSTYPEHGIMAVAARNSDGALFNIDIFRAVGSGFPLPMEENSFAEAELSIKLLFDSTQGGLARVTKVKA